MLKRVLSRLFSNRQAVSPNNRWHTYNEAATVIVFVHGVLSDSEECWLHKATEPSVENVYWPQLVSDDDRFDNPSIYLGGYETSIGSGGYEVSDCANELYRALNRVDEVGRSGPLSKGRIIFVCHSMGGVVVRYLIERNAHRLSDKTIGLVLLASPSYGSMVADRLDFLVSFFKHEQGVQLRWGSWSLRDLDSRFKDLVYEGRIPNLRGIEACEHHFIVHSKLIPNRLVIVTPESAGRYFGAAILLPDTDHFSIAKPDSRRHPSHDLLVDFWLGFQAEFGKTDSAAGEPSMSKRISLDGGLPSSVSEGASTLSVSNAGSSIFASVDASAATMATAKSAFTGESTSKINIGVEPITDPTPAVERRSIRKLLVDDLEVTIRNSYWIALNGIIGSGKTQLAVLITERFAGVVCWIRMRGLNPILAALKLDRAIESLAGAKPQGTWFDWYTTFADRLGRNAIVVIDDLPSLRSSSDLEERMVQLYRVLASAGIALVTTSNHDLPSDLVANSSGRIVQFGVPELTFDECREILMAHNAPMHLLEGRRLESLKAWARSSPFLLTVLAAFLSKREWKFDEVTLNDVISSKFAEPIARETIQRFLDTVEDDEARELLYRLNLTIGRFDMSQIEAVATVYPQVPRPLEILARLSGIWFQVEGDGKYDLSPLVRAIGIKLLNQATVQGCHAALADSILKRGKLSPWEFSLVITHYLGAKKYNDAGRILMLVLTHLQDAPGYVWSDLHLYWWETPLPIEMDWQIKVGIRCLQLDLGYRLGLDYVYVRADLEGKLLAEANGDSGRQIPAMLAHFTLVSVESKADAAVSHLRSMLGLQLPSTAQADKDLAMLTTARGGLIWVIGRLIESASELSEWSDLLQEINTSELNYAMSNDYAEFGVLKVTEAVWMTESKLAEEHRNWQVVLDSLVKCAEISDDIGLELLWAAAVRARILVHAAFLKSLTQAQAIASESYSRQLQDPRSYFLIAEAIGTQLVRARQFDSGEKWLRIALEQATQAYSYFRLPAMGHLAWALEEKDPNAAAEITEEAIQYSLSDNAISSVERFRARAESALAWWWAGDKRRAFVSWEIAAEMLLEAGTTHDSWKEMDVLFMHASAYLGSVARDGVPPRLEDGEEFAAPRLGFFLTDNASRLEYYRPDNASYLALQLAWFAEGVGDESAEAKWLARAVEYGEKEGRQMAVAMATLGALGYQVSNRPILDVLRSVRASAQAHVYNKRLDEVGVDIMHGEAEPLPSGPTSGQVEMAERATQFWSILPMSFHLGLTAIDHEDRLIEEVTQASVACGEMTCSGVLAEVWDQTAKAIDYVFKEDHSFAEIIDTANRLVEEDFKPVKVLMYLGASIRPSASLCQSLQAQMAIMEFASKGMRGSPSRRQMLPFFLQFWSRKVNESSFRFASVQMVRDDLATCLQAPSISMLKRLASTLAFSLKCELGPEVRKWINLND